MEDMAEGCWEAIDDALPGETAILVGCSVGSSLAPYMYHRRPDRTAAMILSGTGYTPEKAFAKPGASPPTASQGHRLSLGVHLRGPEPGISRDADGAFLRQPLRGTQ